MQKELWNEFQCRVAQEVWAYALSVHINVLGGDKLGSRSRRMREPFRRFSLARSIIAPSMRQ